MSAQRVLLKGPSKIDELEKHVQELREVLDNNRPAASVPSNSQAVTGTPVTKLAPSASSSFMLETPVIQTAPSVIMPYTAPSVQMPTLNSPRDASTVGSASFAPPSGTPRSIVQESPHTIIESPYPRSIQSVGERDGRPRAVKVRALESTALAKEQIDVLFQI